MSPITVCLVFFFGLLLGVGASFVFVNKAVAHPRFWKGVVGELEGNLLEYVVILLCAKLGERRYRQSIEDSLRDLDNLQRDLGFKKGDLP